ncbi:RDD family protein [Metabacillus sp. KIGAM252]|uniref:RDD family protein n=1 Tax=Metabacillus flavus TaxID=2823519 RepID=A0ABS5LAA3_9BACI|nr:RDD family protein [Metabacillus flavus]MBS2967661.1 RDD family protein [Metabacillus flavus]
MNHTVKYGGFWIRTAALLIDTAILFTVFFIPFLPMIFGEPPQSITPVILIYAAEYIVALAYFIILPVTSWQGTIGKKLLGLKIVNEHGEKLTIGKSILRYLSFSVSGFVLYIGFIMAGFTSRKQALHDMMVKTYVVKSRTSSVAEPISGQAAFK